MSPSWNQPAYTSADMLTMQQDALRRVREMQARARASVSATNAARAAAAANPAAEVQPAAVESAVPLSEQNQNRMQGRFPAGRSHQPQGESRPSATPFPGMAGRQRSPGPAQNGMMIPHPQGRPLPALPAGRNPDGGNAAAPEMGGGVLPHQPLQRMRVQNPIQSLSSLFGGTGRRLRPGGQKPLSQPGDAMKSISSILKGLGGKEGGGSLGSLGDSLTSTLSSVAEPVSKLLDAFDIDGEKLIILMIMFIIFNERGDKTLLLALGYLLF